MKKIDKTQEKKNPIPNFWHFSRWKIQSCYKKKQQSYLEYTKTIRWIDSDFTPMIWLPPLISVFNKITKINKIPRPKHTKKMTILFFVYFGTHNNKIHTIYKQISNFVWFFTCCCFAFISKAATTKNRKFIYDHVTVCYAWALQNTQYH
jgi:hypothetical protein